MKTFSIKIIKSNVFLEVGKTAAYIGKKKNEGSDFKKIAVNDKEMEIFELMWNEAIGNVSSLLSPFMDNIEAEMSIQKDIEKNCNITIEEPDTFNEKTIDSICDNLFCYVVNFILSKWFEITNNTEEMGIYGKEAIENLANAKHQLFNRQKPIRK